MSRRDIEILAFDVVRELRAFAPKAVNVADLRCHVGAEATVFASAVSLLDQFGAVAFMGEGGRRAMRLIEPSRSMRVDALSQERHASEHESRSTINMLLENLTTDSKI